jgi:DNA polymerase III subunit delta
MKLSFRDIAGFLKQPPATVRAILVYGPDQGLVRERAQSLCKFYVADINDPFNSVHLTGASIDQDPARLHDEGSAMSLMGGMRLIRITDAGSECSEPLKTYLKNDPNPQAIFILEAGNLGPKDSLRKLCEDAKNAVALPCYVEDEKDLTQLIRSSLQDAQKTIDADGVMLLAQAIKGDRSLARMEIEKLLLYAGSAKHIGLDDVKASIGDLGSASIDDFVGAVFSRQSVLAFKHLKRLQLEGVESIVLLRSLQNYCHRLLHVQVMLEQKIPVDEAMKSLHPPVFFKAADQFKAHLRQFSRADLVQYLHDLAQLEARTKQGQIPAELLVAQLVLSKTYQGKAA